jgi:hypothetical protein
LNYHMHVYPLPPVSSSSLHIMRMRMCHGYLCLRCFTVGCSRLLVHGQRSRSRYSYLVYDILSVMHVITLMHMRKRIWIAFV